MVEFEVKKPGFGLQVRRGFGMVPIEEGIDNGLQLVPYPRVAVINT